MIGSLIGDIVGSTFESENHRSKYFEFFRKDARFTDDSVIIYSLYALLREYNSPKDILKENCLNLSLKFKASLLPFLNRGFGNLMYSWLVSNSVKPYHSFGNGSLLRVFPVFKYSILKNTDEKLAFEILNKMININYDEVPQAAILLLEILFLLCNKNDILSKVELINTYIEKLKSLNVFVEEPFELSNDMTANTALFVSLFAISNANSFEDSIRNAISYGGDSDTLACITGGIAEYIWEVPHELKNATSSYIRAFDKELFLTNI